MRLKYIEISLLLLFKNAWQLVLIWLIFSSNLNGASIFILIVQRIVFYQAIVRSNYIKQLQLLSSSNDLILKCITIPHLKLYVIHYIERTQIKWMVPFRMLPWFWNCLSLMFSSLVIYLAVRVDVANIFIALSYGCFDYTDQ